MLYVDGRKSLEGRRGKKFWLCRMLGKNTRQTYHFVECCGKTLGKVALLLTTGTPSDGRRTCRSRDSILPSVNLLPSVVLLFAECLILYTWQIGFITEYNMYAECLLHYTRQISSLPSARWIALGKAKNTRQISSLPSVFLTGVLPS